jgi:hypothetical protein
VEEEECDRFGFGCVGWVGVVDGQVQRRVLCVLSGLDAVVALVDEDRSDFGASVLAGVVEGSETAFVHHVQSGAQFNQQLDDFNVAAYAGFV